MKLLPVSFFYTTVDVSPDDMIGCRLWTRESSVLILNIDIEHVVYRITSWSEEPYNQIRARIDGLFSFEDDPIRPVDLEELLYEIIKPIKYNSGKHLRKRIVQKLKAQGVMSL